MIYELVSIEWHIFDVMYIFDQFHNRYHHSDQIMHFELTRGSLASLGTHSSNYEISIYIIISSTPHGSLALLGSLSAP